MCTYNMHSVTHAMKFMINASLSKYNIEIGLIIHLASYVERLYQEIITFDNVFLPFIEPKSKKN